MKRNYLMILFAIIGICNNCNAQQGNECSNAETLILSGGSANLTGQTTATYTQSVPPIQCNGNTSTQAFDRWYSFTASHTLGAITITPETGFDAVVELLSAPCNGTSISCSDAAGSGSEETIISPLTIGNVYYIRVYGYNTTVTGSYSLSINCYSAPAGDECSDATLLTQTTVNTPIAGQTTVGYTQSIAPISCGGTSTSALDRWYKFITTTTNPTITVVGGAGFDAVVDLRSGSCNGSNISCADATGGADTETISAIGLTVSNTYYIRVYGYGSGANGTFSISVYNTVLTQPGNECSNAEALILSGGSANLAGQTTVTYTQSVPPIQCNGNTSTQAFDRWYSFTASHTLGAITVTPAAGFDAVVELLSAPCNGTNISCSDAAGSGSAETIISPLTIGNVYYIRVYGYNTPVSGSYSLSINCYSAPAGDECSDATLLTQTTVNTPIAGQTTVGYTQSIAPISCGRTSTSALDRWYKFIATTTNPTITVVGGAGFDAVVDLRSGSCNGSNISCADATGGAGTETISAIGLTVSNTYYIRVYGYGSGANGTFSISVFDLTTQLFENDITDRFIVFPNPVSDELQITMSGNNEIVHLEILNILGEVVFNSDFIQKTKVQTNSYLPGVYLIKLSNDNFFVFKKIIKE